MKCFNLKNVKLTIFTIAVLHIFAGCKKNNTTEPIIVDPECKIVNPVNESEFRKGDTIEVSVDISNEDMEVSYVKFLIDDEIRLWDNESPYSYSWDTSDESYGPHNVNVIASFDDDKILEDEIEIILKYSYRQPDITGDGWETATLSEENVDSTSIFGFINNVYDEYSYLQSLIIVRNGKLVLEEYFRGTSRNTIQTIQSSTKSFTSALIGIAIDKGLISSVDEPVYNFFPDYAHLFDDNKKKILLRHVLSMTAGLEWNEWETNSRIMENDNWYGNICDSYLEYVLSKPVVLTPGTTWYYNGGCSVILGAIIERVSGMQVEDFSAEFLFDKLGTTSYYWWVLRDGLAGTHGGLHLRSRDMAKFGQLFLNGGTWNGERIISEDWVSESTAQHIYAYSNHWYGYQWWMRRMNGYNVFFAAGAGGQNIFVVPEVDLVIVTTFNYGSYEETVNQNQLAEKLAEVYVIPAVGN
ncbi:serine hydrolase [candidate division KSB1 bacterium]